MYTTFLKIVWPYVQRYFTRRAAEYVAASLQTRREQRLPPPEPSIETAPPVEALVGQEIESDLLWAEPIEAAGDTPSFPTPFLASNTFWYALSGVALGTAFSLIVTYIFRQEKE